MVVIGVIVVGSGVPEFVERNWLIAAWTQAADTNAAHEGVTAIAELGSEQPCPTIGALINGRRFAGPSGRQNRGVRGRKDMGVLVAAVRAEVGCHVADEMAREGRSAVA